MSLLDRPWRRLIPEPDKRTPLTSSNAHVLIVPWFSILFMAYLVRRPNTYLQRIMLCPVVVFSTIYAYFHHYWIAPRLNVYNWGAGKPMSIMLVTQTHFFAALLGIAIIARALEYASLPHGRLKVGETALGEGVVHKAPNGTPNGNRKEGNHARNPFLAGFLDAMEVLCSMRGIGWTFGTDIHIPHRSQTTARIVYHAIFGFLFLDLIDSTVKLFPQFHTPVGGSIFDPNLPPPLRYLESTFLHFLTGCGFMAGFELIYSIIALIAIGLFGYEAEAWPTILDRPWVATSLHEFWAQRWHQLLRQTFLVFGGYPLSHLFRFNRVLSQVGLIIGTFLASGLFHNLSIYTMGQGTSHHITIFFVAQGFGLIAERLWRKFTGHRVGGWWGTIWVYLCIIGGGQLCSEFVPIILSLNLITFIVDAFHRRGLAGGLIVPPIISPTRRILLPLLLPYFA
jgi:hypothetical protein